MPVCDICNRPMKFAEGFALTTRQVVLDKHYWLLMIELHQLAEDALSHLIQPQASQQSGWLVCNDCSQHFTFEPLQAKHCAAQQIDPPDSGSVPALAAAEIAALAWKEKHGRLPRWLKSG